VALARGLAALRAIQSRPGTTLHELHQLLGADKATLLRSLRTLEDAGFVARRIADGGYLPVAETVAPPRWLPLTEAARPVLEALCRDISWPTDLAVRDGATMLVLESNRRLASIRVNRHALGFRPHMLWSAVGRAWLAFCGDAERAGILALLRASPAPADRAAREEGWIERLLAETRARGYGVRDARHAGLDVDLPDRLSAIAVPVRRRGRIVACINCVWLLDAAGEREIVERYLPTLRKAAAKIAVRLTR
jgi:IclR family mhp operon transcriptional activator